MGNNECANHFNNIDEDNLQNCGGSIEMLRRWVRICQRGDDNVADYLKLVSWPHPWGDKELNIRLLPYHDRGAND